MHKRAAAALTVTAIVLGATEARAAPCGTDEFDGAALDAARWSVLRPAGTGPAVAGGALRLGLRHGTLQGEHATAQDVVLQDAPAGGWTATARLDVDAVDAPGERAGVVLWRSEGPLANTFMTAGYARDDAGAARFEAVATDRGVPATPLHAAGAPAPPGLSGPVLVRLRSDGAEVAAAYSADAGETWTGFGAPARLGGAVRVGVFAGRDRGDGDGSVAVDRFALSCGPEIDLFTTPDRGTVSLELIASADLRDDRDDPLALRTAWDLGDGTTGTGSWTRFHKYLTPGTYRPTLWATDSDGNVTTASGTLTALAADPPCPAASDAFAGNALDPRWRVRRDVPTGLDVRGGRLWLRPYGGELQGAEATARNLVLQPAPAGPWTASTRVDVAALTAAGDRAGLVLWRGEAPGDFATLLFERAPGGGYRVTRTVTAAGVADHAETAPAEPAPGTIHLRLDSDGGRPAVHGAAFSTDGATWTPAGAGFALGGAGPLQVGVVAIGTSVSEAAGFDAVDVEGPQPCGAPDTQPPETTAEHEPGEVPGSVRVRLTAVDDATGSGVARTEYRAGDGAAARYDGPFVLDRPGRQVVTYRSVDRAGNVEPVREATVIVPAAPSPGVEPPAPDATAPPPPAPAPRAGAGRAPRLRITAVRRARRGVRVTLACHAARSVRVTLRVRRRAARKLGLERRTLARRTAPCARRTVLRVTARGRAARALARARRGFRATLTAQARGPGVRLAARRDVRIR